MDLIERIKKLRRELDRQVQNSITTVRCFGDHDLYDLDAAEVRELLDDMLKYIHSSPLIRETMCLTPPAYAHTQIGFRIKDGKIEAIDGTAPASEAHSQQQDD